MAMSPEENVHGFPLHYQFHMPDNGNHVWWYSFQYGFVHLSQEDYIPQHAWQAKDLKSVVHTHTTKKINKLKHLSDEFLYPKQC